MKTNFDIFFSILARALCAFTEVYTAFKDSFINCKLSLSSKVVITSLNCIFSS